MYNCDGLCNRVFHISCMGINVLVFEALNKSKQMKWYCSECNEKLDENLDAKLHKFLIDCIQSPILNAIKEIAQVKPAGTAIDGNASNSNVCAQKPKAITNKLQNSAKQRTPSVDSSPSSNISGQIPGSSRRLRSSLKTGNNVKNSSLINF